MIRRALAAIFWTFSRWKLKSEPQPDTPRILIGAPHTSNWDFIYMLALCWQGRITMRWLGKHTLFKGWRGPIMRGLGGIAVDRRDPSAVVAQVIADQAKKPFSLVITPDGTRGGGGGWKSGFYRIAREANLPVTLGFIDRPTKTVGLGPTLTLTGEVRADMDVIREFYADKSGHNPALRSDVRLRSEDNNES